MVFRIRRVTAAIDKIRPYFAQVLGFLGFVKGKPRNTKEKVRKHLGTPGSTCLIVIVLIWQITCTGQLYGGQVMNILIGVLCEVIGWCSTFKTSCTLRRSITPKIAPLEFPDNDLSRLLNY